MNLTLHLVAKDVRHLRHALILWIGVLLGRVFVSYRLVSNGNGNWDWFEQMSILNGHLLILGLVVTYLLIGLLLLEDPVAGEKMFWVTRPIKGGRLLTAKVMAGLLLFGALPLVVRIPWWISCDFSLGDMAVAAMRLLPLQLLVAIPAFAVASVSTNIGRFLLISVLLGLGVFVAQINLVSAGVPYELRTTREWVSIMVFGVTGLLGTILMYRKRRIGRVILFLGTGLGLSVFALMKFPVVLSNPLSQRAEIRPLENSSQIAVQMGTVRLETSRNKSGYFDHYLFVPMRVLNLPENLGVKSGTAELTLLWHDGTSVHSSSAGRSGVANDNAPVFHAFGVAGNLPGTPVHWDAETANKFRSLEDEIETRSRSRGIPFHRRDRTMDNGRDVGLSEMIPVSEQVAARILQDPPAYRMTLNVETSIPEVLGEIALVPGSVVTRDGRIELLKFARYFRPPFKDGQLAGGFNGTFSVLRGPVHTDRVAFFQIDRKHQRLGILFTNHAKPISPTTEDLSWVGFDLPLPQIWRTDRWVEEPEWQNNFSVGMVTFRSAGTFERSLAGERLNVVAPTEKSHQTSPSTQVDGLAN